MNCYGCTLDADLPLPDDGSGEGHYRILVRQDQTPPEDVTWKNEWRNEADEVELRYGATASGHLLRFPGYCDFAITIAEPCIIYYNPAEHCDRELLAQLLLDQVIPRVLSELGHLVLHASAVANSSGDCIAFLGPSGRGKSTLATYLCQQGYQLVADDCAVFATTNPPRLWRAPSQHRLHEDSHYQLTRTQSFSSSTLNGKLRVTAAPPVHNQFRLRALFMLHHASTLSLVSKPTPDHLMTMVEQSFRLNIDDKDVTRDQFHLLGELGRTGILFAELHVPHEYTALAEVQQCIAATLTP